MVGVCEGKVFETVICVEQRDISEERTGICNDSIRS